MRNGWSAILWAVACILCAQSAGAQVRLDRADPSIRERELPQPAAPVDQPSLPVPVSDVAPASSELSAPRIAAAIVIDGNAEVPTAAFAPAITSYVGRDLSAADLSALAGAIADTARKAGYPFASAAIEPQAMANGVLHVSLDEGRIAAVRVIGAVNPLADRMLTSALVTPHPVRRRALERVILLVGDIAGVTIKDSKYIRQDGFGILLVTIAEDRASAYAQIDNRGSAEVGPIRSTILGSLRSVAQKGDELGVVAALTPLNPSEFAFLRGRYSAPIDLAGGMVSVSASYGRAHPGASLSPLNVIGNSMDLAASYNRPLIRSRASSLWGNLEFRALESDLSLLGRKVRDDRLTTLTASFNGAATVGPGVLRGDVTVAGGLPLAGVTHQGDARTSRSDGDARFVTLGYTVEWAAKLADRFALVLGSSGQLASRPLLATAEIGAGGPGFGRAYDYAERTGDQGILGSAELRADAGRVLPGVVDRLQLYSFVDGGHVSNLRGGPGGGSLLSTGAGARLGFGGFDGMVELALPLNANRFDTGNRRPRFSFRVSRSF